jgi:peroxiredoxin
MDPVIKIGQEAPQFQLPDLRGELFSLEKMTGWIRVLYFWSAECEWCERVDDELKRFMETWGERVKVWWIASNGNEPFEFIEREAQKRNLPRVLLDGQLVVANLYGAETTPHFFVVDSMGRLAYQGAWDDITFRQRVQTQVYVPKVVEALLQNLTPPISQTPPYGCVLVRLSNSIHPLAG